MIEVIPDDCCPLCSHLRFHHRELFNDVLRYPTIVRGNHSGTWRVYGCSHLKPVLGPHQTEEDANHAVAQLFAELRAQKARGLQAIENIYATAHETSTQREITGGADGPQEADPSTMPGEATGETRGLPKSLAGQASGLPGEDETAVAEAPLCRVGARIHDRHTLGIDGRCERCGWEFPRVSTRP